MRQFDRNVRDRRNLSGGFTLVEMLVVIAIIGLLVSLILVAAADGVRRAEERATQGLITKLETAVADRLDALLNVSPPINQTHRYVAAINYNNGSALVPVGLSTAIGSDDRRSAVIAKFDFLRANLPDVFFPNWLTSGGDTAATNYPLNFGGAPYPAGQSADLSYALPLGNYSNGLPLDQFGNLTPNYNPTTGLYQSPTYGMYGASFAAAGGIYKNLGYNPKGYDGVDNNGNGLIDEIAESGTTLAAVKAQMSGHTHKSARSEMLYAILVEGLGPLGSVFNREDFTNREVQDTDNDGLPEFVDAWGEPLQFFRWPIYYGTVAGSSDTQNGGAAYSGFSVPRQQDPLDPNQLLVAPGWWASAGNPGFTAPAVASFSPPNGGSNTVSQGAMAFMHYFHILVDPYAGSTTGQSWDRGGGYSRREFFSKFLIVSGGPDKMPGIGQFGRPYNADSGASSADTYGIFPLSGSSVESNALSLIYIENQASQTDPSARTGSFYEIPDTGGSSATTVYLQQNVGLDDISNHNISAPGTGVR